MRGSKEDLPSKVCLDPAEVSAVHSSYRTVKGSQNTSFHCSDSSASYDSYTLYQTTSERGVCEGCVRGV